MAWRTEVPRGARVRDETQIMAAAVVRGKVVWAFEFSVIFKVQRVADFF